MNIITNLNHRTSKSRSVNIGILICMGRIKYFFNPHREFKRAVYLNRCYYLVILSSEQIYSNFTWIFIGFHGSYQFCPNVLTFINIRLNRFTHRHNHIHQPTRVTNASLILWTLVKRKVASVNVVSEYSYTFYIISNRLFFITCFLTGTHIGNCSLNGTQERVAVNHPSRILT